ncbi:hypothetical protein MRX96_046085 [Rhipicephalus microplus]
MALHAGHPGAFVLLKLSLAIEGSRRLSSTRWQRQSGKPPCEVSLNEAALAVKLAPLPVAQGAAAPSAGGARNWACSPTHLQAPWCSKRDWVGKPGLTQGIICENIFLYDTIYAR